MIKKILIIALLAVAPLQAQLANQINKTVDGLATVRNNTTLLDSLFFTSTYSQAIFDIIASLQKYGKQAGNYSDISAALTAAIVDTSTLIVSERHNITSNTTLSGVSAILMLRNGIFNITSGDTLTISVPFTSDLSQRFEGAGVVQFTDGSVPVVEVEWFGSGQAGVNKAIQSLTATGGNVRFSKAITITDSILIDKNHTHFYGSRNSSSTGGSFSSTPISVNSGSSDAIVVTGSNCLLENFTIDGGASKNGDDGIRLESLSTIRGVSVIRMGGNGIRMGQDSNNMNGWILQNIFTFNNDSNGVYIHDAGPGEDANAGVVFYLYSKNNGLDGLRLETAKDNQFYMYRGDTNTGYGIRLKSGAKGNFFSFPYLESNTAGTGIIESGALQNFIFGTRQGTDDGWTDQDTNDDNVVMGRNSTLNDMYQFQGRIAFEHLSFLDDPFELSGLWTIQKDSSGSTRNLEIIAKNGTGINSNFVIKRQDGLATGVINLVVEDGGLTITGTDGDQADISMNTVDQMLFRNADKFTFDDTVNVTDILEISGSPSSSTEDGFSLREGASSGVLQAGASIFLDIDDDANGATESVTIRTNDGGLTLATFNESGLVEINGTVNFAADGQADDDYEIALPGISVLTTGLTVTWTANTANTGGATLEITSATDIDAILKLHDQALVTGDIEAGQVVVTVFDGTNWQMISQLAQ